MVINNLPDNKISEIREIAIYDSYQYSYIESIQNREILGLPVISFGNIIPEDFSLSCKTKKQNNNLFYELDVIFDLEAEQSILDDLMAIHNKKVVIKYSTNHEQFTIGNDREPFIASIIDLRKHNDSGADKIRVSITGKTLRLPMSFKK